MEFPITDLLSPEESEQWLLEHFHPDGLVYPGCGSSREEAYAFRTISTHQLTVYPSSLVKLHTFYR
jgi:hypothetical protein